MKEIFQAAIRPPTFVFFVNDATLFPETYRRYMEKQLRSSAGFTGTPIRLLWRSRKKSERQGGKFELEIEVCHILNAVHVWIDGYIKLLEQKKRVNYIKNQGLFMFFQFQHIFSKFAITIGYTNLLNLQL